MPQASPHANRFFFFFNASKCCRLRPCPGFSPRLSTDVTVRGPPPRCGARHEALNEGFLSAVGGFARQGVGFGHGRVIFTGKLTARAFQALQVIPRHCLLMEFSVTGGCQGLANGPGRAIRGAVALTPASYSFPQICSLIYSKYKAYCIL